MNIQRDFTPRLWIGGLLILLGGALILMNLGVVESVPLWRYWPAVLVLFGAQKMSQAQTSKEQKDGFWYSVIGIWLLVSMNGWFDLGFSDTWPFLIVAWGISVMWEGLDYRPSQTLIKEESYGK